MRHSQFWTLLREEFGQGYAESLARDHVFGALGDRTAVQALGDGVRPAQVWAAVCADFDVPPARRYGRDRPARR